MHSVLAAPGAAMAGTVPLTRWASHTHLPPLRHRELACRRDGTCGAAGLPCRTHVPLLYVLLLQLIYTGQPRCSVLTPHSPHQDSRWTWPGWLWLGEWLPVISVCEW